MEHPPPIHAPAALKYKEAGKRIALTGLAITSSGTVIVTSAMTVPTHQGVHVAFSVTPENDV